MGLLDAITGGGDPAITAGQQAPDFSLPDASGTTVKLSDYRGKKAVVLYFYPKDDTPGCTKESCQFRDNLPKFKKSKAAIFGISILDEASKKRFADKCRAGRFTAVDLYSLARHFEVSFQAMALRLEDLRLLPRGSYEKIARSQIRPRDLARHEPPKQPGHRRKLPERYIGLAVAAYDQELLSEGEFAEYLDTDIADARRIFQERQKVVLDDGSQLLIDFGASDLRTA